MPVFQRIDPLSAASDAVGSFYAAKRQKQLEDAAAAHTAARDQRQDLDSDRSYGIQQADLGLRQASGKREEQLFPGQLTAQSDTHNESVASIKGTNLDNQKKINDLAFQKATAAINIQIKQLDAAFKRGEITSQAATLKYQQLNNQKAQFEVQHQAQDHALTVAQAQASIAASQASANSSNASAWRTRNEPFYNPNAATASYTNAISSLSPAATSFIQRLQSSGTTLTPIQAELSVRSAPGLTATDKANVMTILQSSSAADFQPLSGKPVKNPVITASDRQNATIIAALQRNPKVKALPANAVADLIQGIQHKGYEAAIADYKAIAQGDQALSNKRGISQQQAQSTLSALGVQTQSSGGGFFGLHF